MYWTCSSTIVQYSILFFAKLAAFYSTTLHKRESLIIFDEVQQYPRACQLIKYLVADGRFDYLETGSLIRLKRMYR
ncbi:MAG: AAA family ATPase, partial [Enterocloster sp.]